MEIIRCINCMEELDIYANICMELVASKCGVASFLPTQVNVMLPANHVVARKEGCAARSNRACNWPQHVFHMLATWAMLRVFIMLAATCVLLVGRMAAACVIHGDHGRGHLPMPGGRGRVATRGWLCVFGSPYLSCHPSSMLITCVSTVGSTYVHVVRH
ncbi:hypothetical protein Dimus_028896 [Dionaea muscipula]